MAETLLRTPHVEKLSKYIYTRSGNWSGKNIKFLPLNGHITQIDTHKDFGWGKCEPIDIVKNSAALILKENPIYRRIIRKEACSADELWLATDPDSEGDNIAYEAYLIAIKANPRLVGTTRRVWNSSLTEKEILRSFQNLKEWESNLALGVQGRRMIDAWVGFSGTREVTRSIRRFQGNRKSVYSVGRVQLPTLKLIVDNDRLRDKFSSQLKYRIMADVKDDNGATVAIYHVKSPFEDIKEVEKILAKIKDARNGYITEFTKNVVKTLPPKPLNTTDTLSLLTRQLKIKADVALKIMADLYEKGFISYPRTDNKRFKEGFPHKPILDQLIGVKELTPHIIKIKKHDQVRNNGNKKGVEDHDPIFPTGKIPKLETIGKNHYTAWEFITNHYIGLFMDDLVQEKGKVIINIKDEKFTQMYQRITSKGWTTLITWKKPIENPQFSFTPEKEVEVLKIYQTSFKTKPPKSYTDATLLKKLESLRIGTKSSRPDILKKLFIRGYITRKGMILESTSTGKSIIELFEGIWEDLVTPTFTRNVEQYMDEVATKNKEYSEMKEVLRKQYLELHEKLIQKLPELNKLMEKTATENVNKAKSTPSGQKVTGTCPLCEKGQIVQRYNQKNKNIFFGCTNYPSCKWTSSSKKTANGYIPAQTMKNKIGTCPQCSGNLFYKTTKDYRFVGCTNYPSCKYSYFLPKKGRVTVLKKECPKCNRKLLSLIAENEEKEKEKKVICVVCDGKS